MYVVQPDRRAFYESASVRNVELYAEYKKRSRIYAMLAAAAVLRGCIACADVPGGRSPLLADGVDLRFSGAGANIILNMYFV